MKVQKIITTLLAMAITATSVQIPVKASTKAAVTMIPEQTIEAGNQTDNSYGFLDDPSDAVSQADIDYAASLTSSIAKLADVDTKAIKQNPNANDGRFVIALDPGHGGTASGAVAGGIKEKDINLTIAKYVKQYLEEYRDVEIYMTRTKDVDVSLTDRVKNAVDNGADVFISLHNNSATNTDAKGAVVFYPNESYNPALNIEGKGLAQSIQNELVALGLNDRGIQVRDSESGNRYADGKLADYYSVIYNSKNNGITGIIVEHAFLSNTSDRTKYLSSTAKLKKLALADAQGIANYYNLVYNKISKPDIILSTPSNKGIKIRTTEQEGAEGYRIYRSATETGGYEFLVDTSSPEYVDTDIKQDTTYYYKIKAFTTNANKRVYSTASKAAGAYTIGGTTITGIKQTSKGNFVISWKPFEGSDGFAIYRQEEDGAFERYDTVTDPNATSYVDKNLTDGMTYTYRVRTIHNTNGIGGFGKNSQNVTATKVPSPEITKLTVRDDGYIRIAWEQPVGTSKMLLQRATGADGKFTTIAEFTADSKAAYLDKSVLVGPTYYYRTIAYNQQGLVSGSTGYTPVQSVTNVQEMTLTNVKLLSSGKGIKMRWTTVAKANGYIIYRSTSQKGGYTRIAKVTGETTETYTDATSAEVGQEYFYKVKAYITNEAGNFYSNVTDPKSAVAGTAIMGKPSATVEQMENFFKTRGGQYPTNVYSAFGAATLRAFCQIVYDEAVAEGVRPEVVFAQICKETGFLRFGGDVSPEQCNFAGIGATGGVPGNSFPSVAVGVRAQVQHLKAYASDEDLNQECVDPRFKYVKRKTAVYVEWLGIKENPTGAGWATGVNYGYSLRDDYLKPLLATNN